MRERSAPIQRNRSRQGGGKLPGVRVVGARQMLQAVCSVALVGGYFIVPLENRNEALDIFLCFAMIILQYVDMEEPLYNIHYKEKLPSMHLSFHRHPLQLIEIVLLL